MTHQPDRGTARVGLLAAVTITLGPLVVASLGRLTGSTALQPLVDLLLPDLTSVPGFIWLMSLLILLCGIVFGFGTLRTLAAEWQAIYLLHTNAVRTMVPPNSIIGRRIQVMTQATGRTNVLRTRQRLVAESRIHFGGIANTTRFLAGSLLLVAVLGTFAGIKGSLPALMEAISGQQTSNAGFERALGAVAGAFGANFLGLLGSLGLGLAAHAASIEGRALATRVEEVSDERLFHELGADEDASYLQRAIENLEGGVRSINNVGSQIASLSSGLGEFTRTTNDALKEIQNSFNQHASRVQGEIQRQLGDALTSATKDIRETTGALVVASEAFSTLADSAKMRDGELVKTCESIAAQVQTASRNAASFTEGAQAVASQLSDAGAALAKSGNAVAEEIWQARQSAASAAEGIKRVAGEQNESIRLIASRLDELRIGHESIAASLAAFQKTSKESIGTLTGTIAQDRTEQARLLRDAAERLAASVQRQERDLTRVLESVTRSAVSIEALESTTRPLDKSARSLLSSAETLAPLLEKVAGDMRALTKGLEAAQDRTGGHGWWQFWRKRR